MATLSGFTACWIITNTWAYTQHFDPYPFILLNLILSIEAGLMMPLMVMMNNTHAEKDRKMLAEDLKLDRETQEDVIDLARKLDQILEKLNGPARN